MAISLPHPPRPRDVRRLSLEEYHRLVAMGFFPEDERVELIEGVLHPMSPKGPRHATALTYLLRAFITALGERAEVRAQDPITIPQADSEPEPDLTLARPRKGSYADRHPLPEEVLLVVEIAESSLREDREITLPLYAAAGIPECWIVNLVENQVEVHREPVVLAGGRAAYRQRTLYGPGDTIRPLRFPDCAVDVTPLLP